MVRESSPIRLRIEVQVNDGAPTEEARHRELLDQLGTLLSPEGPGWISGDDVSKILGSSGEVRLLSGVMGSLSLVIARTSPADHQMSEAEIRATSNDREIMRLARVMREMDLVLTLRPSAEPPTLEALKRGAVDVGAVAPCGTRITSG